MGLKFYGSMFIRKFICSQNIFHFGVIYYFQIINASNPNKTIIHKINPYTLFSDFYFA